MKSEIMYYDLLNLIKEGKAPKNVAYDGDIYELEETCNMYDYWCNEINEYLIDHLITSFNWIELYDVYVEAVEENDEWEDINELDYSELWGTIDIKEAVVATINLLIKNQKYLKERLDKDD